MSELQDYYRLFDMFKGKLNEEQKKTLEGLEDQLIAEEILHAISESVAPVLSNLRRPFSLVVDYDPEVVVIVKTTRGEVVVKENTAKKYQIPNTTKVVVVSEVADEDNAESEVSTDEEGSRYSRGSNVKLEVWLNSKLVDGKGGHLYSRRSYPFDWLSASCCAKYYVC